MIKTTLFIPLSGRVGCWASLSDFLERQDIDKASCKLYLLDTSGSLEFGSLIQEWVKTCDYPNVVYEARTFSDKEALADRQRLHHFEEVNRTIIAIYNYAKTVLEGEVLFIVEDDIVPPIDAYNRLVASLTEDVFVVSGAYNVRNSDKWVLWRDLQEAVSNKAGVGVEQVAGTGFGCFVIKAEDYKAAEITWENRPTKDPMWPWGFDMEFFSKAKKKVLVDWDVYCEHQVTPVFADPKKPRPAKIAMERAGVIWGNQRPKSGRIRAVITVATGPYYLGMLALTRPFMQAYCERVDADFIDLDNPTEAWGPMEKFRVRHFAEQYEEILFIDADAVIMECCPNLFELHKEDIVCHDDWPKLGETNWLFRERNQVSKQAGLELPNPETCLNSGIVLTRYNVRHIWDRPTVNIGTSHCAEQIWLEYRIQDAVKCGSTLGYLDSRANWQWWFNLHNPGSFEAGLSDVWIAHFANAPDRCRAISDFVEKLQ